MIDLNKFTNTEETTVPVVAHQGRVRGRKFSLQIEDGWYRLLVGNSIEVKRKATKLEIFKALEDKKSYLAYSLGADAVPFNFNQFFEAGKADYIPVMFNQQPVFTIIEISKWEDGNLFFRHTKQRTESTRRASEAFTSTNPALPTRGIGPELRLTFWIAALFSKPQQSLGESPRDSWGLGRGKYLNKFSELFNQSSRGLLEHSLSSAGGELVSYARRGSSYEVTWRIGSDTVKTLINKDMRVESAGFCIIEDDQRHTLESLAHTAKKFQEDLPLHITRS